MTSSVIRRTEELKLLDSRFERLMEEYDESKMGCIEEEELEGILRTDTDVVEQALQEFEASQLRAKIPETEADADECMSCFEPVSQTTSTSTPSLYVQMA